MLLILTLKPQNYRFFTDVQNDIEATGLSFRACRGIFACDFDFKTQNHRFFTDVQNDIEATDLSFRACRGIYAFDFDFKTSQL